MLHDEGLARGLGLDRWQETLGSEGRRQLQQNFIVILRVRVLLFEVYVLVEFVKVLLVRVNGQLDVLLVEGRVLAQFPAPFNDLLYALKLLFIVLPRPQFLLSVLQISC